MYTVLHRSSMFIHVLLRFNEKRIAELNRERESAEYRARTTRLAKWRELCARAQEELQVEVSVPERITLLGCT